MRVRTFKPYSVIKVKSFNIQFGIKAFFLNLNLQVYPDRYFYCSLRKQRVALPGPS